MGGRQLDEDSLHDWALYAICVDTQLAYNWGLVSPKGRLRGRGDLLVPYSDNSWTRSVYCGFATDLWGRKLGLSPQK